MDLDYGVVARLRGSAGGRVSRAAWVYGQPRGSISSVVLRADVVKLGVPRGPLSCKSRP